MADNDGNKGAQGDFVHRAIKTVEGHGPIGVSVGFAYFFAFCLIVLPPFFIIGDPWGVATDLRFFDEIYSLTGGLVDDGDYATSARPLSWTPFLLAIGLIVIAYRMRAHRQIMTGRFFGIDRDVPNQTHSFFFGRGMNVLFPYGPGDQATAQALVKNGADVEAATTTVFYYRIFEILACFSFMGLGLAITGWEGAGIPFLYCLILFFGLGLTIRPLGRGSRTSGGGYLDSLGIRRAFHALREIGKDPRLVSKLYMISLGAMALEMLGLILLKNALSTGDIGYGEGEYFLLEEMPFAAYFLAISVASLARIIPFTPGGMGIYELSLVTVFGAFEAEATQAAATAMVDGFVTNAIMLVGFFLAVRRGNTPSILGSWGGFYRQSGKRLLREPIVASDVLAVN